MVISSSTILKILNEILRNPMKSKHILVRGKLVIEKTQEFSFNLHTVYGVCIARAVQTDLTIKYFVIWTVDDESCQPVGGRKPVYEGRAVA